MRQRLLQEWRRLTGAYQSWQNDDGPLMAAAVAYYLGLSLFPLLLVLIAGVGLVLKYTHAGQDAEQQVIAAIAEHLSPSLTKQVEIVLENVQDRSAVSGPVGLLGIVLAAVAGFAQFERAFDRIWRISPPERKGLVSGLRRVLLVRGKAFLMLLGLGLLVFVVFLADLVFSHIDAFARDLLPAADGLWPSTSFLVTALLNALILTLIYRWLPKVQVGWRDACRGGIVAAVGWELGRQILATFLIGTRYSSAYGVIGSFIAILLWCYYAVAVIFLGAEYIQECQRELPPAPYEEVS